MSGRAGRPQYDKEGEALVIAKKPESVYWLMERYILSDSEDIYSKLAAKPALRRNILGLIASNVVSNIEELLNFFEKTFYGYQFDAVLLEGKIREIIEQRSQNSAIVGINSSTPDYFYFIRIHINCYVILYRYLLSIGARNVLEFPPHLHPLPRR